MELYVWPSEFGLPSIDIECLQFMAAAKFCAAPVTFVPALRPWRTPHGDYPHFVRRRHDGATLNPTPSLFTHGAAEITDFGAFVDFLRTFTADLVLDAELIPAQLCEFDAYSALLRQRLRPALTHLLWLDADNFAATTHHLYAGKLPFPYNMYFVERKTRKAKALIKSVARKTPAQLTFEAIQVINMLSAKLADNKYFCGDKPSSLDALIFGYLAPLLHLSLPNDRLQMHLCSYPNLVRFVESILSIYLPPSEEMQQEQSANRRLWARRKADAQRTMEEARIQREERKSEQERVKDMPMRETVLFAVAALLLSMAFAIHTGIIRIETTSTRAIPGSSKNRRTL